MRYSPGAVCSSYPTSRGIVLVKSQACPYCNEENCLYKGRPWTMPEKRILDHPGIDMLECSSCGTYFQLRYMYRNGQFALLADWVGSIEQDARNKRDAYHLCNRLVASRRAWLPFELMELVLDYAELHDDTDVG
jgi:transcription elongation factor Elf1